MTFSELKPSVCHHYVVFGFEEDDGTIKWYIDDESTAIKFANGNVFDERLQAWSMPEDSDELVDADIRLHNDLYQTLECREETH